MEYILPIFFNDLQDISEIEKKQSVILEDKALLEELANGTSFLKKEQDLIFGDPISEAPDSAKKMQFKFWDSKILNEELKRINLTEGMPYNDIEQLLEFTHWLDEELGALRIFIKIYYNRKDPAHKKNMSKAIMDIVKDINNSKKDYAGDALESRSIINNLVKAGIFLNEQEKKYLDEWDIGSKYTLNNKVNLYYLELCRQKSGQAKAIDICSLAIDIQDFFNKTSLGIGDESLKKKIPGKAKLNRLLMIKDLVRVLKALQIIEPYSFVLDDQYNKCLKWSQAELDGLNIALSTFTDDRVGIKEMIRTINNKYDKKTTHTPDQADMFQAYDEERRNVLYKNIFKPIPLDGFEIAGKFVPETEKCDNIPIPKKEKTKFNKELRKAGIRVAATSVNKVTKKILLNSLPSDKLDVLTQFFDSELGISFVSMISGMALTYGLKNSENAQIMAKEFRVSGMTAAGNFAIDEMLGLVKNVVKQSLSENIDANSCNLDSEIDILYEDEFQIIKN